MADSRRDQPGAAGSIPKLDEKEKKGGDGAPVAGHVPGPKDLTATPAKDSRGDATGDDTPETRIAKEQGAVLSSEQHSAATTPRTDPEGQRTSIAGLRAAMALALPMVLGSMVDVRTDDDQIVRIPELTPVEELDLPDDLLEDLQRRGVIRRATEVEASQIEALKAQRMERKEREKGAAGRKGKGISRDSLPETTTDVGPVYAPGNRDLLRGLGAAAAAAVASGNKK